MGTTLSSGQTFVLSAASAGLTVPDGATLDVAAGGVAGAATVAAGGSAIVVSGGVMSSGVLEFGKRSVRLGHRDPRLRRVGCRHD